MRFRQLLPQPAEVELGRLLDTLAVSAPPPSRPYVRANFAASVDGRTAVQGRSGGLGDDGDRAMFHGLREQVDAVMVGTGTLASEHYGRLLARPERRERRIARGMTAEPLACVFTRSGRVPLAAPLFSEPQARVVIFAPGRLDVSACAADVEVIALAGDELTLTSALAQLRSRYDVASLLCEGGPRLFGGLLAEDLVDELFLTIAPKLVGGGSASTVASGPGLPEPRMTEVAWLLERHGSLYARYHVIAAPAGNARL